MRESLTQTPNLAKTGPQHPRLTTLKLAPKPATAPTTTRPTPFLAYNPSPVAMAAAIKALNAKIRSNKYTDYFCSTRMCLLFACRGGYLPCGDIGRREEEEITG